MEWLIGIGLVIGLGKTIIDAVQGNKRLNQQEEQLRLQQEAAQRERERLQNEYKQSYQNALDSLISYEESISQQKLDIEDYQSQKSSYENLLGRWQDNYNLEMKKTEASAYSAYKDLLSNWTAVETVNAAKGISGRTALARENQSNQELKMYLGEDMRLNSAEEMSSGNFDFNLNGGILGQAWNEQRLDLLSDKTTYQNQIDILSRSLKTTQDALKTNLSGLGESLTRAKDLAGKAGITDTAVLDRLKEQYGGAI